MRRVPWLMTLLLAAACDEPARPDGGLTTKPQAFITLDDTYPIAPDVSAVTGLVNVSGCRKIAGLEVWDTVFLKQLAQEDGGTRTPVGFTLEAGLFTQFFKQRGLAVPLTLRAKVTCDDGRTNESQPVSATYFPVQWRKTPPAGSFFVHENILAEGGFTPGSSTFLGCESTNTGQRVISRVNEEGQQLAVSSTLGNIPCGLKTVISEVTPTGKRWVFEGRRATETEAGTGVYAIDNATLEVVPGTAVGGANPLLWTVASDGSAVVWARTQFEAAISKRDPNGLDPGWATPVSGTMIAPPYLSANTNELWVAFFRSLANSNQGHVEVEKYNLLTGQLIEGPTQVFQLDYNLGPVDSPIPPPAVFGPDGVLYVGIWFPSPANNGTFHTQVARWDSRTAMALPTWTNTLDFDVTSFDTSISNVLVAASIRGAYFLNTTTGGVLNLGGQPLRPTGNNLVLGLQAGREGNYFVLTGPRYPCFGGAYVADRCFNEIIATDTPVAGELWRVNYGSANTPSSSIDLSVDDNNNVYMRLGPDLARLLNSNDRNQPLKAYRELRGPSPAPTP